MTQTILILGGSGRFGRHATDAFTTAGWLVRQFDRARDDLNRAMSCADVVLMGWNPGGYHLWEDQMVPLHEKVAREAAKTGTTVILPGNVYVYGPDAPIPWGPSTPHRATNPLGKLRVKAEAAYRKAGARVIILRCGDFVDTEDTGNWFESYITKSAAKGVIRYPGDPDAPHSWAWLPDAARATVALAERRRALADFEDVPFPGYTLSGNQMAAAIGDVFGRPVRAKPFNWGLMRLLRPFMPMLKGVFEMRYLWSLPHRLDGARFEELVPDFDPTPPEKALTLALGTRT